jgi:hypothetical protein
MSYCGPQYTGKGCECQLQVTPGVTPATQEAANPQRICAFREEGIQYACDPGCCPTDCSTDKPVTGDGSDDASAKLPWYTAPWFVILAGLLFGLIGMAAIIYRQIKDAR